jgi:hypothetical protein
MQLVQELEAKGDAIALRSLMPFVARLVPEANPSSSIPLQMVKPSQPVSMRVTSCKVKFRVDATDPSTAGIGVEGACRVEVEAQGAVLEGGRSKVCAEGRVMWSDVLSLNAEQARRRCEELAEQQRQEAAQAQALHQQKVCAPVHAFLADDRSCCRAAHCTVDNT